MLTQLWLTVGLVAVAWFIRAIRNHASAKLDFPVVGSPADRDFSKSLVDGYAKYPDTPFYIPTSPARLILPMKLFNEAMHAPTTHLSFLRNVYDLFLGLYTHIGRQHEDLILTIRSDLTKNLPAMLPLLQDEIDHGLPKEFGTSGQWTPLPAYMKMLRLVALVSGRIFVGLPLCREETWIHASISYTTDVAAVMHASQKWNSVVRPLVAPFLPEVRKAQADLKHARKCVAPLVDEVMQKYDAEKPAKVKVGGRGTFISWMLKYQPDDQRTAERVGINQMVLSFVSIHTTSMTITFALLDLASRPEYIEPLRAEIEQVIKEDGMLTDENGQAHLSKSSFQKLVKLDSFIKESQRFNPLNLIGGFRTTLQDFTFSTGLTLPKSTVIAFPMWAIYQSTATEAFGPEVSAAAGNPGPDVFDGFRFAKLRAVPGYEAKHQLATTSEDSLNFGHGPHSCPGRFFAVYEIKSLLVNIIRHYDIRLKDGKQPSHMVNQVANVPDPRALIEVRRRNV
ncbi:gibberellin cluster-C13-oxidase [Apiospora rasikravindrae]|uniref:Gibberellin cluster-C13-oxidase n=1 Tax=Apiospora rasikravindrae TaxID=990691 RepID=A0ABR1RS32_9PEZI